MADVSGVRDALSGSNMTDGRMENIRDPQSFYLDAQVLEFDERKAAQTTAKPE